MEVVVIFSSFWCSILFLNSCPYYTHSYVICPDCVISFSLKPEGNNSLSISHMSSYSMISYSGGCYYIKRKRKSNKVANLHAYTHKNKHMLHMYNTHMHIHTYTHVQTHTHAHAHTNTCTNTHIHIRTNMYKQTHTCTCNTDTYVQTHTYTHIHTTHIHIIIYTQHTRMHNTHIHIRTYTKHCAHKQLQCVNQQCGNIEVMLWFSPTI